MDEEKETTKTGPYRVSDFEINVKNCQKLSKMLKIVKIGHLQWAAVQKRAWWEVDFLHHFKDNA